MTEKDQVRMNDDRLGVVLADVGRHLVVDAPTGSAVAPARRAGRSPGAARRTLLVAALVITVVTGTVLSIAPARRVVGGWLRAGGIDVSVDPDVGGHIDGLPSFIEDATPIDPDRASDLLVRPPTGLGSASLGAPDGWWTVPEGGLLLTWNEDQTSLWIVVTDDHQTGMIDKLVASAQAATAQPGLGDGGLAVSGPHVMQTEHRRVAANSVVAWPDGGFTWRLESVADLDDVVARAESIAASVRW